MLKYLRTLFEKEKPYLINKEDDCELCIVGNIVDHHYFGEQHEVKRGTKLFAPNTKVYILPEYPGTAHENVPVIAKPRNTRRLIKIVIPAKRIMNYRAKIVYKPLVIGYIRENWFYEYWKNKGVSKREVEKFVDYMNSQTELAE